MLKSHLCGSAMLLALAVPAAAHAQVLGSDAAACAQGASGPAVLVRVDGFKTRTGVLRVQLYGGNPDDFLAKGKKLRRIEMAVTPRGPMDVCLAAPRSGNYAVAVRHDTAGDGPDWNDGGGFSRNPPISLFNLRPKFANVVFPIGRGVREIRIVLNYRQGLAIRPIAAG